MHANAWGSDSLSESDAAFEDAGWSSMSESSISSTTAARMLFLLARRAWALAVMTSSRLGHSFR